MRINRICLNNFRNYEVLDIAFKNNINIFIGDNAQGKTNILEAIHTVAMTSSHRTNDIKELVKWNQQLASIKLECANKQYIFEMMMRVNNQGKKEYLKNDIFVKIKEFFGQINVVMFSPEDLFLIKGAPSLRRKFIDNEISQTNRFYYQQLLRYNRIILQRNNLLKTIREKKKNVELLAMWDEELSEVAADIIIIRLNAVQKLAMLANLMHRKITKNNENLKITYYFQNMNHTYDQMDKKFIRNSYLSQLENNRTLDIEKGYTTIGPHRDDIILEVNHVNVRTYGSQGQQRTGVLALKLAELEFIKSQTGQYPVLLLDDVMSELDEQRREQLLFFIKDRIQTFITSTDSKLFPNMKGAQYYKVVQGTISE